MSKKIYLDYQATTPVSKEILEKMIPYFSDNQNAHLSRQCRQLVASNQPPTSTLNYTLHIFILSKSFLNDYLILEGTQLLACDLHPPKL